MDDTGDGHGLAPSAGIVGWAGEDHRRKSRGIPELTGEGFEIAYDGVGEEDAVALGAPARGLLHLAREQHAALGRSCDELAFGRMDVDRAADQFLAAAKDAIE
ncbi:hypothetical protein [Actinopolymorpha pittospori]|uniref:Uncharacterized protein n=1 Tax=Actinopolymorpha pittospori TaxID=648752 RepID=A0A927RB13_9ACTN|nr:hypothetical protein [Actinopolymorpha pittospori]MBE1608269.1 hypothetical protein [Actinopolymorpha pittospori]